MCNRNNRLPEGRSWRIPIVLALGVWLHACGKTQPENAPGALDESTIARSGEVHVTLTGSPVRLTVQSAGEKQSYHWRILARPSGSASVLSDSSAANPAFKPDKKGTYLVELIETKDGKSKRRVVTPVEVEDKIEDDDVDNNNDKVNHNRVTAACVQCHNGVNAMGVPPTHLRTTQECESCHSVKAWRPAITVDHKSVLGFCLSCHNGTIATGKSLSHTQTNADCNVCHLTNAWIIGAPSNSGGNGVGGGTGGTGGVTIDHATVTGMCYSCHNGIYATPKHAAHILTTVNCDACHTTSNWVTFTNDHREILGRCETCHWSTAPADHTAVGIVSGCESCHIATATWPVTLPGATLPTMSPGFVHEPVAQPCSECHNGISGHTGKPVTHIPVTNDCAACHSTAQWLPIVKMDHTQTVSTCVDCHNGVVAKGKSPTHPATSNECAACHVTNLWPMVYVMDHTQAFGSCDGCHNGDGASGKSISHPQTTNECNLCHSTTAWLPAVSVHQGLTGGCAICHNGIDALGKNITHFATSDRCEACHSWDVWKPAKVNHMEVLSLNQCVGCHNNIVAVGKGTTHPTTADQCGQCHSISAWLPTFAPPDVVTPAI